MRHGRGFTALELLITVTILGIVLAGALPSFSRITEQQRLASAGHDLMHSLLLARATANIHGSRTAILAKDGNWSSGWWVFVDNNKNGVIDADEPIINEHGAIATNITIRTGKTAKRYIGFNKNGNSVQASNAFLADSLTLCPSKAAISGLRIKISISGRSIMENVDSSECLSSNS